MTTYMHGPANVIFTEIEIGGKTHYSIRVLTEHQEHQVAISPEGRSIRSHTGKTPPGHFKREKG